MKKSGGKGGKRPKISLNKTKLKANPAIVQTNEKEITYSDSKPKEVRAKRIILLLKRKVVWIWGAIVMGLLAGYITLRNTWDYFQQDTISKHEKFEKEEFIKGILVSRQIQDRNQKFYFSWAGAISEERDISELRRGVSLFPTVFNCKVPFDSTLLEFPVAVKLKLEDDRIKVSRDIVDFSGKKIGIIENNVWKLRTSFIGGFKDTDSSLQIWDDNGYLPLGIYLQEENKIVIKGYFPGEYCTMLLYKGITTLNPNHKDYSRDFRKEAEEGLKYIDPASIYETN